jgi:hypothetical protein
MDAQTYHDINATLKRLREELSRHLYGTERHGMVPPEGIDAACRVVTDAHATLVALRSYDAPMTIKARLGEPVPAGRA